MGSRGWRERGAEQRHSGPQGRKEREERGEREEDSDTDPPALGTFSPPPLCSFCFLKRGPSFGSALNAHRGFPCERILKFSRNALPPNVAQRATSFFYFFKLFLNT